MEITHEKITKILNEALDSFDVQDAEELIALLSETYTLEGVWTWLMFYNAHLDAVPINLLEQGKGREVWQEARRLRGMVAS